MVIVVSITHIFRYSAKPMYSFENSWQSVFTDCSFIFSFDVELLDIGFNKGSLFLEMLSSIGLYLKVILSLTKDSY